MGNTIASRPWCEEVKGNSMTNPYQVQQAERFFLTEDVAAEIAAAGYEFKSAGYARTKSVRDLYG